MPKYPLARGPQEQALWDAIFAASPNPYNEHRVEPDAFMRGPLHEVVFSICKHLNKLGFYISKQKPVEDEAMECVWGLIEDGRTEERDYSTACGEEFIVDHGTPANDKLKFCPYCGKPIHVQEVHLGLT